ncbi:MAG TPA: PQQ-dependent sugar dehydrogenase [Acidothermaceae bacterium]|jgi:glucose/arabinose dehydrogenase|nr:PQQ-dependent sugar dehydrogenase [Acidothermaceae bacterium]
MASRSPWLRVRVALVGVLALVATACHSTSGAKAAPSGQSIPPSASAAVSAAPSMAPASSPAVHSSEAASAAASTAVGSPGASPAGVAATTQPVPGGPILDRTGITLRKVVDVPQYSVRLALDPVGDSVYVLNPQTGLERVDLTAGTLTPVAKAADIVDGVVSGLAFGPNGAAYVVANKANGTKTTHAIIRRGTPNGTSGFTWSTLAITDDYPLGNDSYDHLYNGIVVSPDGSSVFVNAGSRTDHGEVESNAGQFPGVRELPLTSAIFKLPANANNLALHDTDVALKPYLYADGTRNAYSLAFAPNGQLFATDNGPDADFPDELNLIQQGANYGFPWRFGNQANPQSLPGYDPSKDPRIEPSSGAAQGKTYYNDPTFQKAPTTTFTDPLVNVGPDAADYVDDSGTVQDAAAQGTTLSTFTPHISPLGLVFTSTGLDDMFAGGQLHAFMLSWGASIGDLPDQGKDLDALTFFPTSTGYTLSTEQLAEGFDNPIDDVLIGNHLYVLEYGQGGAIWELTFS